jgi:uncharacterized DUF497 family protein
MRIEEIVWLRDVVDKLSYKHGVETFEVEEALKQSLKFRFMEKGERDGEDVYMALGQTDAGRYLVILFIHTPANLALVLSARNMTSEERRKYGRK